MAGGATGILGALRIIVDADTSKAQKALQSMGGRAQVFGAAVGAAAGGAAIAGLRMADTWDTVTDTMRGKIGATGRDMGDLEGVMKSVGSHVTEDFHVIGDVVTQLAQTTDLTGEALARNAESIIDLARLTGSDYAPTVKNLTDLYNNWGVATTDQVALNDTLLKMVQATGADLQTLTEDTAKYGGTLRGLGFGLTESAALFAQFEREGLNVETVVAGLKKGLVNFTKAGEAPAVAMERVFGAIKNAPDDIKGGQVAMEAFGNKAGPELARLIREGRLELGTLVAQVEGSSETVQKASDDTRDFADGWSELMNSVQATVGPLLGAFAGIGDAMGNFIFLLPALGGALGKGAGKLGQKFGALFANATADAAAGPLRVALTKMMAKIGLEGAATSLAGRFASLFAAALPIVGVAALGVAIGVAIGKAIVGPEVEKSMKEEAGKASAALAGAVTVEELDRQRAVLEKGLADAEALPFSNFLFGSSDQLRAQIADIDAKKASLEEAAKTAAARVEALRSGIQAAMADPRGQKALAGALGTGIGDVQGMLDKGMVTEAIDGIVREWKDAEPEAIAAMIRGLGLGPDAQAELASRFGTMGTAIQGMLTNFMPDTSGVSGQFAGVGKAAAKGIRGGFRAATREVGRGFGNVADALKNPPKLRSKAWRLDHLQKQMRQVMANLRKAVKANDPVGVQYWEAARAKVANSQRWLSGKTKVTMRDIRKEYKRTGVNVDGTWKKIKSDTQQKAGQAQQAAVSEAQQTKTGIDAVDLRSSGIGMMGELASGIYAGIPQVRAASTAAASAAAAPLEAHSPPKEGPLSTIDTWGAQLVGTWAGGITKAAGAARKAGAAVAGAFQPSPALAVAAGGAGGMGGRTVIQVGTLIANDAGLDELERRMGNRQRIRKRQRRDPRSPNGMDRG